MVREFLNKLKASRFEIEEETERGDYVTAQRIAEGYGYKLLGLSGIAIPPYPVALFVGRTVAEYNVESMRRAFEELKDKGYIVVPTLPQIPGKQFYLSLILGKKHDGGGTALLENALSLVRNPVVAAGYDNGRSVMGFFLDTPPEHYGDVELIAGLFGMEPRTEIPRAKIPDIFLEAFGE